VLRHCESVRSVKTSQQFSWSGSDIPWAVTQCLENGQTGYRIQAEMYQTSDYELKF
jgi:hypothetical protein